MKDLIMQCEMTMNRCGGVGIGRTCRRSSNPVPRVRSYAIAIAVAAMMFSGARFALEQPSGASEFAAATYAFDSGWAVSDTAHAVPADDTASKRVNP
jgi:hypothetical protein